MDVPKLNISMIRSSIDQSLYCFYCILPMNYPPLQTRFHFVAGQFIHRGDLVLEYSGSALSPFSSFKSPLSGSILKEGLIANVEQKQQKVLLFSIKLCQHYPRENTTTQATQIIPKLSNPIFNAIQLCGDCNDPVWFYYEKDEILLTYFELTKDFDDFDISDFEWKVILNEHFTKNTQIGSTSQEQFYLPCSGKPVFLEDISLLKRLPNISPSRVMLKYKKVVCKHERISNNHCQFCLMTIADIGVHKFKRYLFQVADASFSLQVFVSGKALEEQEAQFKQNMLSNKKALFVLDLDNTILHSIELFKVPEDIREIIQDYIIIPPEADTYIQKSLVKIRPYFKEFLEIVLPLYDIYVYTKGTRLYAEEICKAIRKKYPQLLSHSKDFTRCTLVSRDEDPNPKKSLNYLLPNLHDFILILDDRRDVWDHSPLCIFTKPYYYFFFYANIQGKEKIQAAEWEKGGGSLIKETAPGVPVQQEQKIEASERDGEEVGKAEGARDADNSRQQLSLRLATSPDSFLLYAALTLVKSHEMYFKGRGLKDCQKKKTGRFTDMAHVQKEIRADILRGMKAVLMIPNYKNSSNTYRRALKLGLLIIDQEDQCSPDLVIRSNDYRKAANFNQISMKLKAYGQANRIPVVSESWIDLCYEYSYCFPYQKFMLPSSPSSIMLYPKPEALEQAIGQTLHEAEATVKTLLNFKESQGLCS